VFPLHREGENEEIAGHLLGWWRAETKAYSLLIQLLAWNTNRGHYLAAPVFGCLCSAYTGGDSTRLLDPVGRRLRLQDEVFDDSWPGRTNLANSHLVYRQQIFPLESVGRVSATPRGSKRKDCWSSSGPAESR